ncbi:MAG: 30S ribosomal protein S21 [Epsilonproteobacteria bacterium]|nr:30S ribosomal protein S21 [Campylobacterota bacterium]
MPGVVVRNGESFEEAYKRFQRQCERAAILSEIKKRDHYEKPSEKKKRELVAAKKKARKRKRMSEKMYRR